MKELLGNQDEPHLNLYNGRINQTTDQISCLPKTEAKHHLLLRLHVLWLQINGETPTWNGVKWVTWSYLES